MTLFSLILDRLERAAIAAAIVILLMMALLMNVEVFSRYLFGRSTQIADEFAGYFFTAVTLLCFVPALRHGRFLRVEALVERVPAPVQAVLNLIAAFIGALMSMVLAWTTFQLAFASWNYGTVSLQAIQVPLVIPQAILPLGFGLLALAFIEQGVLAIVNRGAKAPKREPELLQGLD
jgi:TRAP-type C4-dicarboxylate transport system permease small subunit